MKPTAPPRVDDVETYWGHPPPEPHPRTTWWVERIRAGWRPNRRISSMGYYERAEHFGVYIHDLFEVIDRELEAARVRDEIKRFGV